MDATLRRIAPREKTRQHRLVSHPLATTPSPRPQFPGVRDEDSLVTLVCDASRFAIGALFVHACPFGRLKHLTRYRQPPVTQREGGGCLFEAAQTLVRGFGIESVTACQTARTLSPNLLSPNLCGHMDASRFGGRRDSAAAQPDLGAHTRRSPSRFCRASAGPSSRLQGRYRLVNSNTRSSRSVRPR